MTNSQLSSESVQNLAQSMAIATVPAPAPVEAPSAWMRDGTSPTEIILATAVVIMAIGSVIVSMGFVLQMLVPVMMRRENPKSE